MFWLYLLLSNLWLKTSVLSSLEVLKFIKDTSKVTGAMLKVAFKRCMAAFNWTSYSDPEVEVAVDKAGQ